MGRIVSGQDDSCNPPVDGNSNDALVLLNRQPNAALGRIDHDIAEKIPAVPFPDGPAQAAPAGDHLQIECLGEIPYRHCDNFSLSKPVPQYRRALVWRPKYTFTIPETGTLPPVICRRELSLLRWVPKIQGACSMPSDSLGFSALCCSGSLSWPPNVVCVSVSGVWILWDTTSSCGAPSQESPVEARPSETKDDAELSR